MSAVSTNRVRKWVTVIMLVIFVTSLVGWFVQRDKLPGAIRVSTGEVGGLYYRVGTAIEESLQRRTNRRVAIKMSHGSEMNIERVAKREAELGIMQGGLIPSDDLSIVSPLFPEYVFVIVRKTSNIDTMSDLSGKAVALGKDGSGSRNSALVVLKHYGIRGDELEQNRKHFTALMDNGSTLDAAIVTGGIAHSDIQSLLTTHEFNLLPIHSAPGIELLDPFLRSAQIPRGLFAENPPVPATPIPTIATTAYLVARQDASDRLVEAALDSIHEENMRIRFPTLIPREEASTWVVTRMHPSALRYFNPSDDIGQFVSVMQSLVATKELLFAMGAGIYLMWVRWRRLKEDESDELLSRQKEHLDEFLEKTLEIERAQMETEDPIQLRAYLDQVTCIKLKALHEFTEEELRGDQSFTIFLDQCRSIITKIQMKILWQITDQSSGRH
ncbi:MAG: TAXI family TRAP transporter solute-binding subunit [Pirellulaceae bacterium]